MMMQKVNYKSAVLSIVVGGLLLGLAACASTRPTAHQTALEQEAVVIVEAIDVTNRRVTVREASGDTLTVYVDKSNTAFPQAKVGDQVRIRFVESMAFELKKSGEPSKGYQVTEASSRPTAGKPSAATASEVKTTVKIEAVTQGGSKVTFTGPRGRRTVQINDPSLREYAGQLKPGDNVEVTYKEALALSLEKVNR